jgi:hypothetical protein
MEKSGMGLDRMGCHTVDCRERASLTRKTSCPDALALHCTQDAVSCQAVGWLRRPLIASKRGVSL